MIISQTICVVARVLLLLLLCSSNVDASSSTDVVPVTDIEEYIESGTMPPDANSTFPSSLSSTIIIAAYPLEQVFDTTEVVYFQNDMLHFYQTIFESQSEYDLIVREVHVLNQVLKQDDKTLELETRVDVNFRPNPSDQVLTHVDFHNIVSNLVNKFENELVQHLKKTNSNFDAIETIKARNLETAQDNTSAPSITLYVMIGIMGFMIVAAIVAVCVIYKKRVWSGIPRYITSVRRSPFGDEGDSPSKGTTILGDDDEDDVISIHSNRFSFRPGLTVPESPETSFELPSSSFSPRRHYYDGYDRNSLSLTLESNDKSSIEEALGSRVELWAPAGKLGVAIDVVKGWPIVWRIKAGSPLEGFLEKGDIIVAIDEIDTSHMSAADVTSVMVRRMRQRRKIVYIRPTPQHK